MARLGNFLGIVSYILFIIRSRPKLVFMLKNTLRIFSSSNSKKFKNIKAQQKLGILIKRMCLC